MAVLMIDSIVHIVIVWMILIVTGTVAVDDADAAVVVIIFVVIVMMVAEVILWKFHCVGGEDQIAIGSRQTFRRPEMKKKNEILSLNGRRKNLIFMDVAKIMMTAQVFTRISLSLQPPHHHHFYGSNVRTQNVITSPQFGRIKRFSIQ